MPSLTRRLVVSLTAILTTGLLLTSPVGAHAVAGSAPTPASTDTIAQTSVRVPDVGPAESLADAPEDTGSWGPVLDWGIQGKHMAMLSTGKVLVWSTGDNASVWNPSTGQFTATPAIFGDLHCAGQSILADGRVIVIGGQGAATHDGLNITALFDPVSQTWTQGQDMTDLRWYATSTTLADGRVLATSGDAPGGIRSEIPEVYDPATDTWTRLTTAQRSQVLYPSMFVLPNGKVYEAGSRSGTAILDPTGTGSWTSGPTAGFSTSGYSESAVMYRPGQIMRVGGDDPALARTAVVDMTAASPAWRITESMEFARRRMNLTILADGTVMAIGGTSQGDDVTKAVYAGEIWDPVTETWSTVEDMTDARMYHSSALLLPDGRVLTAGGESDGRLRAQIYSPPYLFSGARPTIGSSPATAAYGTSFTVATPQAGSITSVALIRPSAVTHALDMDQRYVPLTFTAGGSSLNVTAPASGGVAPPGYYMLVVKNASGVPSVASWIRIGTATSLQPGTVRGQVTNAVTGAPMSAVAVTSSAGSTTTGSDGRYTISGVPAGDLEVTFSRAGFATLVRSAIVTGGQTTTLDVGMSVPGNVNGQVTNAATGAGIAGATVVFPGGSTVTDSTGAYSIAGLPSGSVELTYGAAGFVSTERTVTVPAGGAVIQTVALAPSPTYVTGDIRDAVTTQVIVGATVEIDGHPSSVTDALGRYRIDLPAGEYTVTASADGYSPASGPVIVTTGLYTTLDLALAPSGEVINVSPAADSYVRSTSTSKNYGLESLVRIRNGSPTHTSFLKFNVAGTAGRTVTSATLRVYATDGGPNGGTVYRTSTGWTEAGLTWANAPQPTGSALATKGSVATDSWVEFALPAGTVTGDGPISLSIVGNSTNSVYYSSREGANPPELRVQLEGSTPPPPAASFTVTPSSGQAPLAVTVHDTSTGQPTSWSWDWGDGGTATGATPAAHTYATPGTYTITLTAANAGGPSTASRQVTVTAPPNPGSRIKDITFEGGLLHATAGVDVISGTTVLETSVPLKGTVSARIPNAVGYLEERFTATNDLWLRLTLRVDSLPTSSPRLVILSNAGVTQGNLYLTTSGRLRLKLGTTTIGADSAVLTPGTTYQVGLHQRRGTGSNAVVEAFLAPDGSGFGTPFAASTTGTWTTAADRTRIGATNGTAVAVTVDDILLDSGSMPSATAVDDGVVLASWSPTMTDGAERVGSPAPPASVAPPASMRGRVDLVCRI